MWPEPGGITSHGSDSGVRAGAIAGHRQHAPEETLTDATMHGGRLQPLSGMPTLVTKCLPVCWQAN